MQKIRRGVLPVPIVARVREPGPKALPQWGGARGGRAQQAPSWVIGGPRRPHLLLPAPLGSPGDWGVRPLGRYCRAPVPAVRDTTRPRGSFGVGACGGDRGYGACQDQLGDRPLVGYLAPLLAGTSSIPCTWGQGVVGSVLSRPGSLCGSRTWPARPRSGLPRGPHRPVFRRLRFRSVYVALCRGPFPGRLALAPSLFLFHHY